MGLFSTPIRAIGEKYAFVASGTISAGMVVEASALTDWHVIAGTDADVKGIGVARNDAVVGGVVEVAMFADRILRAISSAAITRGDQISLAASGKIKTLAGTGEGERKGIALNSATGADQVVHFIPTV